MKTICKTISEYNKAQTTKVQEICDFLEIQINKNLKKSESKIWHGSPVWFIAGNPMVAYSVRKDDRVSLMFFSGQSFDEMDLKSEGKFKAAEIFYADAKEIKITNLKRWLKKSIDIQWDYKNIVKRKGVLEKMPTTPTTHDQRFANMTFASIYPLYLAKVEKKGRTKEELNQIIKWLTDFDDKKLQELIKEKVTFEIFFKKAKLNKNAHLITGVICGYRVEDIADPLTQKVRYLDKLVDELAKGRKMEKILRK
jgi:hypothetical protein